MSLTVFRFLHLVFALGLAGAALGGVVVRAAARRSNDLRSKAFAAVVAWRLHVVLGLPSSILAGLLGGHLVMARGFSFAMPWVQASLAVWIVTLALIVFYIAPRSRRTARLASQFLADGSGEAALRAALEARLPGGLAHVGPLAVIVLTWLMVFKPGM
jgi:uncharacterized membrane protein